MKSVAPMSDAEQVARVQAALQGTELEGWLFFHFRGQNPIATALWRSTTRAMAARYSFSVATVASSSSAISLE